jgi:hypothetical protein
VARELVVEIWRAPPGGQSIYRSVRRFRTPREAIGTHLSGEARRRGPRGSGDMGVRNFGRKTPKRPPADIFGTKNFFFPGAPPGPPGRGRVGPEFFNPPAAQTRKQFSGPDGVMLRCPKGLTRSRVVHSSTLSVFGVGE